MRVGARVVMCADAHSLPADPAPAQAAKKVEVRAVEEELQLQPERRRLPVLPPAAALTLRPETLPVSTPSRTLRRQVERVQRRQ
jgi:hypothetical protein